MIIAIITAECRAAARTGFQFFIPAMFLFLAAIIVPMTQAGGTAIAPSLAHGAIWLAVIFSALTGLHDLFLRDLDDGSLTLYGTSACQLELYAFAKLAAHWLMHILPMLGILPVACMMLSIPVNEWINYLGLLLLATIWIIWLGGVIAAILAVQPQSALLLPFIALPMMIPVVIFGAAGKFYFLAALCALAFPLAPLMIAAILRGAEENL